MPRSSRHFSDATGRGHTDAAPGRPAGQYDIRTFGSEVVDRVRAAGNVWELPDGQGQIVLPRVFGFCRGVSRALSMLEQAVAACRREGKELFLLGQIIHNPWVNDYFRRQGVRILSPDEMDQLAGIIAPSDCAVVPAFGVPLPVERSLRAIGCEIVDTSCGDVRRVWAWAERTVGEGFAVLIFGRSRHDETIVTKSRLAAAGGRFLVVGSLEQVRQFCDLITGAKDPKDLRGLFDSQETNARTIEPFARLAQVSQTTMLYEETIEVRRLLRDAFLRRFGREGIEQRLTFQPTVCRATQNRQAEAVELCRAGCDLIVVVGGFGSSNTRHLFELARCQMPAFFIEDAGAIRSTREIHCLDAARDAPGVVHDWLPARRPLRIGVLAGASSPEVVVGEVLEKLAAMLARQK